MTLAFQTNDARVLSMLRTRQLTRYQIQELLGAEVEKAGDGYVNQLLESMTTRHLVDRVDTIKYGLTKRGTAALALIDEARPKRRTALEWVEHQADVPVPTLGYTLDQIPLLTRSPAHRSATTAELRGTPPREGGLKFLEAPSRFGNTLRYRNGRVTDMAGNELQPAFRFTAIRKGD